jgi:hypothetical protein
MLFCSKYNNSERDLSLQLPGSERQDSQLAATVSVPGTSIQSFFPPVTHTPMLAAEFNEHVAYGAISKAGGLPAEGDVGWLKFAQDKLMRDNRLDHQSLLWEMGGEVVETLQREHGGLNVSNEIMLLDNMNVWFTKGGGKLRFVQPTYLNSSQIFRFKTTEEVLSDEVVLSVPFKLIMCRQTARNVLIPRRSKYLGEELAKTFDKDESWALALFLLHEYYKEVTGVGSKWGPYIRTLRMRLLSTSLVEQLKGTAAALLLKQWLKEADSFVWWSGGAEGPCSPTTGICNTKPNEKFGDSRFNQHQLRWAYLVVKQSAVRVRQISTGLEFLALIPYYHHFSPTLVPNQLGSGGVSFEMDGSVTVRLSSALPTDSIVTLFPGKINIQCEIMCDCLILLQLLYNSYIQDIILTSYT